MMTFGLNLPLERHRLSSLHVSCWKQKPCICHTHMYPLLLTLCLFVGGWSWSQCLGLCVCWRRKGRGGCWKRGWNEQDLDWRIAVKRGVGEQRWNKHLEVTQADSGLVCSLYQWGPGPWALGVYLSSWGTTAHYSPPIMPHRAPFLCLNWGAVCAPMNYSIYLLCRSEVCLEKLLQTPKFPRVCSLICTELTHISHSLNQSVSRSLRSAEDPVWVQCSPTMPAVTMHSCYVECAWPRLPPFPILFLHGLFMGHVVCLLSR